jgi:polyhydroxyalkanoate synthase
VQSLPLCATFWPTGRSRTLDEFIAGATETKGSWWPEWISWIGARGEMKVKAKGARVPGRGKL